MARGAGNGPALPLAKSHRLSRRADVKTDPKSSAKKTAPRSPWVKRGRSGIHRSGLFARRAIPLGTPIIEYLGHKVTKAAARRIEAARLAREAAGEEACVYVFDLDARHDLDGDVPWNPARHINHSCEPNADSRNEDGRIWIVARRDIRAGEEITFDYGYGWKDWPQHPCRCGTKSCPGFIIGKFLRKRLRKHLRAARRAQAAAKKKA